MKVPIFVAKEKPNPIVPLKFGKISNNLIFKKKYQNIIPSILIVISKS